MKMIVALAIVDFKKRELTTGGGVLVTFSEFISLKANGEGCKAMFKLESNEYLEVLCAALVTPE